MNIFDYRLWGAFCGAILFILTMNLVSHLAVHEEHAAKPGYALPGAEAEHTAPAVVTPLEPLPALLAKADPKKGEASTKVCSACHSFDKGGAAKVGPNLWGVVNRPIGSVAGFSYSDAMKSKGGDWSYDNLNAFLTAPKLFIPGTKMGYAGESDAAKRADLIAYLRSLSDSPAPLPAP